MLSTSSKHDPDRVAPEPSGGTTPKQNELPTFEKLLPELRQILSTRKSDDPFPIIVHSDYGLLRVKEIGLDGQPNKIKAGKVGTRSDAIIITPKLEGTAALADSFEGRSITYNDALSKGLNPEKAALLFGLGEIVKLTTPGKSAWADKPLAITSPDEIPAGIARSIFLAMREHEATLGTTVRDGVEKLVNSFRRNTLFDGTQCMPIELAKDTCATILRQIFTESGIDLVKVSVIRSADAGTNNDWPALSASRHTEAKNLMKRSQRAAPTPSQEKFALFDYKSGPYFIRSDIDQLFRTKLCQLGVAALNKADSWSEFRDLTAKPSPAHWGMSGGSYLKDLKDGGARNELSVKIDALKESPTQEGADQLVSEHLQNAIALIREEIGEQVPLVVPMPSGRKGHNLAYHLAYAVASEIVSQVAPDSLRRKLPKDAEPNSQQSQPTLIARMENIGSSLFCANDLAGRPVILVDDVEASGVSRTMAEYVLQNSNAGKVYSLMLAKSP